jgi:hypothetical protein
LPMIPPIGRLERSMARVGQESFRSRSPMRNAGSWITASLYFLGAYSCRATSIHLSAGSFEIRSWTARLLSLSHFLVPQSCFKCRTVDRVRRRLVLAPPGSPSRFHQGRCRRNDHIQPRALSFRPAHIAGMRNRVGMRSHDCRFRICARSFPTSDRRSSIEDDVWVALE